MQLSDYRTLIQEKVLKDLKALDFSNPDWAQPFTEPDASTKSSIIIWYLKELVEKGEFVEESLAIAEIYSKDQDPSPEQDDLNQKILTGEDVSNIYTVRGTACWLLTAIAATFRTEFYSRIISLVEDLSSDPVYYVRIQATVPLSFFAANIRAVEHKDGRPFDFTEEDKKRVRSLCFRVLEEHRDVPRVLEGLSRVFNAFRTLNEDQARKFIQYFFRNSKQEMQPEYITRQAIPLLIYFAEYRSLLGDGFDGSWFEQFARELLALPQENAPYIRSTFTWHVWKEIDTDQENYEKLKKYIPLFLHTDTFEQQPLSQYDFLILRVLKVAPDDGIELFKGLLNYIEKWAHKYDIREHAWMLSGGEIIQTIAPIAPDKLLPLLEQIIRILKKGVWIGDIEQMFKSYLLIPDEGKRAALYPELKILYEQARGLDRVGKLGDL